MDIKKSNFNEPYYEWSLRFTPENYQIKDDMEFEGFIKLNKEQINTLAGESENMEKQNTLVEDIFDMIIGEYDIEVGEYFRIKVVDDPAMDKFYSRIYYVNDYDDLAYYDPVTGHTGIYDKSNIIDELISNDNRTLILIEWKPKHGDYYFYIDFDRSIYSRFYKPSDELFYIFNKSIGNVFQYKNDAEEHIDEIMDKIKKLRDI